MSRVCKSFLSAESPKISSRRKCSWEVLVKVRVANISCLFRTSENMMQQKKEHERTKEDLIWTLNNDQNICLVNYQVSEAHVQMCHVHCKARKRATESISNKILIKTWTIRKIKHHGSNQSIDCDRMTDKITKVNFGDKLEWCGSAGPNSTV